MTQGVQTVSRAVTATAAVATTSPMPTALGDSCRVGTSAARSVSSAKTTTSGHDTQAIATVAAAWKPTDHQRYRGFPRSRIIVLT